MNADDTIDLKLLLPGQIIARKSVEFWDKLSTKLGAPYTEYVHFTILADPIGDYCDWYTFNATVRSVMMLVPLSSYAGQRVRIYSVNNGDIGYAYQEGKSMVENRVPYEGLSGWNYILRLAPKIIAFWFKHGIKPVPYDRVPNVDSPKKVNCLTLMRRCYPDIIPINCGATAFAFEQAYREGRLILEQEGKIPGFRV